MKITNVRLFELEGPLRTGLGHYDDPRFDRGPAKPQPYRDVFFEIETDAGVTGFSFAGNSEIWPVVKTMGREIIGEDPLSIAGIWEKLYSYGYHRYRRLPAIAVIDLALWDIAGKVRGEPVYRLLGGPTREHIRAYAAMQFFPTEPELGAKHSIEMVEQGFTAVKWYIPYGAEHGKEGMRKNVALIAAVREAVGDDIDIMIDCLFTNPPQNDLLYMIELARRLEEYRPTWIEEPLNFDDIDAYATLAHSTSIPIAVGERCYNRWQIREVLNARGVKIVQPDVIHAGGITEMQKIISLASTFGVVVAPHACESCIPNVHLLFAQPSRTCPLAEYNVRVNAHRQYFYKKFVEPINGYFEPPVEPGLGWEIDPEKIVKRTDYL
jgi:L-rhamnonate dehydratase